MILHLELSIPEIRCQQKDIRKELLPSRHVLNEPSTAHADWIIPELEKESKWVFGQKQKHGFVKC